MSGDFACPPPEPPTRSSRRRCPQRRGLAPSGRHPCRSHRPPRRSPSRARRFHHRPSPIPPTTSARTATGCGCGRRPDLLGHRLVASARPGTCAGLASEVDQPPPSAVRERPVETEEGPPEELVALVERRQSAGCVVRLELLVADRLDRACSCCRDVVGEIRLQCGVVVLQRTDREGDQIGRESLGEERDGPSVDATTTPTASMPRRSPGTRWRTISSSSPSRAQADAAVVWMVLCHEGDIDGATSRSSSRSSRAPSVSPT